MRQHGEIEKDEEPHHLPGGILAQCKLKHAGRGHHETQQQRVLPDFGGQLDEHRKQANQDEADPAHGGPQKPGEPAEKYPAEDCARDHRRQAKEQLRRSQLPPHVQEQNQQGRMSQSKTRLVSLRQRGFVRGQKVHGLVEIEKGAGGFPEAEKKRQRQHQAREAIFPCRTFSHGAAIMIPAGASNVGASVPLVRWCRKSLKIKINGGGRGRPTPHGRRPSLTLFPMAFIL